MIRDMFEEMSPPESVAIVNSQGSNHSDKMAETLDLHFKAHGLQESQVAYCHELGSFQNL